MAFLDAELSLSSSKPIELYKFTDFRYNNFFFTSSDKSIVFQGDTYKPEYLKRSSIKKSQTIDKNDLKITITKNNEIVDNLFNVKYPKTSVRIEIYRLQPAENDFVQIFSGVVLNPKFIDAKRIELTCKSIGSDAYRQPNRYNFQYNCNNSQYSNQCGLNIFDYTKNITIDNILQDGRKLISSDFGLEADDYYRAGMSFTKPIKGAEIESYDTTPFIEKIDAYSEIRDNLQTYFDDIYLGTPTTPVLDGWKDIHGRLLSSNSSNELFLVRFQYTDFGESSQKRQIRFDIFDKDNLNLKYSEAFAIPDPDFTYDPFNDWSVFDGAIYDIYSNPYNLFNMDHNDEFIIIGGVNNIYRFDKKRRIFDTIRFDFKDNPDVTNNLDRDDYKFLFTSITFSKARNKWIVVATDNAFNYFGPFNFYPTLILESFQNFANEAGIVTYNVNELNSTGTINSPFAEAVNSQLNSTGDKLFFQAETTVSVAHRYIDLITFGIHRTNELYSEVDTVYSKSSSDYEQPVIDQITDLCYIFGNNTSLNSRAQNTSGTVFTGIPPLAGIPNGYNFIFLSREENFNQAKIIKKEGQRIFLLNNLISTDTNQDNTILFKIDERSFKLESEKLYTFATDYVNTGNGAANYNYVTTDDFYGTYFNFLIARNDGIYKTYFEAVSAQYTTGFDAGKYGNFDPTNEFRQIIEHGTDVDGNYIILDVEYDDLQIGDRLFVSYGCKNSRDGCKLVNNFENFMGFEFVPEFNPHERDLI